MLAAETLKRSEGEKENLFCEKLKVLLIDLIELIVW